MSEAQENDQITTGHVDMSATLLPVDNMLQNDASMQGLQELIDKLEPLLAGGRLTRMVDLLSVVCDLVDMSDDYMLEKLVRGVDDAVGGAWTMGNAARMARVQVSQMQEPPSMVGLLRMARQPDARRGLAWLFTTAAVLGKGMRYDPVDDTED